MTDTADAGQSRVEDSSPLAGSEKEMVKQSGGLTTVMEASRAELDRLLAETQHLHERSWRAIHTLLEDSQLRASQAVDECLARFEQEIQARVSSEMAMMVENFEVEAGARLAARLDQALATAKQRQHSLEQDLAVAVTANRRQSDQISADAIDGLRQNAQSLSNDLQGEAERQLGELAKKATLVTTSIRHLGDSLSAELKQRAEEAVQFFQSRSEQVWQEFVTRAQQQLAETARSCTADLATQARQAVDQEMSEFLSQALRRFSRSSDAPPAKQNT